jgi:hypothetical protein
MAAHDNSLCSVITLKKTLPVAMVISWNPDRLLGIIGLEHILTLHLHGDNQVRRWVWVRLAGLAKLDMARHVGALVGLLKISEIEFYDSNFKTLYLKS